MIEYIKKLLTFTCSGCEEDQSILYKKYLPCGHMICHSCTIQLCDKISKCTFCDKKFTVSCDHESVYRYMNPPVGPIPILKTVDTFRIIDISM